MPRKTKSAEKSSQQPAELSAPGGTKNSGERQRQRRGSAVKKSRKPGATKISASPQAEPNRAAGEPAEDEIRLRAYYISERRRRLALSGDADSDWLEARRQLLAERRR